MVYLGIGAYRLRNHYYIPHDSFVDISSLASDACQGADSTCEAANDANSNLRDFHKTIRLVFRPSPRGLRNQHAFRMRLGFTYGLERERNLARSCAGCLARRMNPAAGRVVELKSSDCQQLICNYKK